MARSRTTGRRAFATWLAIVALLVQGLLPLGQAVSVARADDSAAPLVICTAYGLQEVPADGTGAPVSPDSASTNCPVCQVYGASLVLPTPVAVAAPVSTPLHRAVVPVRQGTSAWQPLAALPRGPPARV